MQPGCAWPSSTYRRVCTGKKRTSGLQACNLGINGRKNVLCVHPRKISEVRVDRQLRVLLAGLFLSGCAHESDCVVERPHVLQHFISLTLCHKHCLHVL
jgi:hypothetical protein